MLGNDNCSSIYHFFVEVIFQAWKLHTFHVKMNRPECYGTELAHNLCLNLFASTTYDD